MNNGVVVHVRMVTECVSGAARTYSGNVSSVSSSVFSGDYGGDYDGNTRRCYEMLILGYTVLQPDYDFADGLQREEPVSM